MPRMSSLEPQTIALHGRPLSYVQVGSGPVLLLIHGIAGSVENWQAVIEPLARHHTVLAPDLPGHGRSAPGAGDRSLGALAAALRDLLVTLRHERATLVGHSLGGGIALQFAYQFPELTERLVLVSSGGLGREVSAVLRAAALPGADRFIAATAALGSTVGTSVSRRLSAAGLRCSRELVTYRNSRLRGASSRFSSGSSPKTSQRSLTRNVGAVASKSQATNVSSRLYDGIAERRSLPNGGLLACC